MAKIDVRSFPFFTSLAKRVPVVLQVENSECGLACLAMIAGFHGRKTTISELRSNYGSSARGMTLAKVVEIASQLEFGSRALRAELSAIGNIQCPAILHWNMDHFVVLEKVSGANVHIIDPGVGRRKLSISEASKSFTGVAVELRPTPKFKKAESAESLRFGDLLRSAVGLRSNLAKIFAVSIVIQFVTLIVPLYTQFVIDEVIGSRDGDLLLVITTAFLALTLFGSTIGLIRKYAILYLGANLEFGWAGQIFHHLIRLPLDYFEKRSMADVLSRFRSIEAIRSLVSTAIVEALLDGIMAITTLVVMLAYSPSLAAISFIALFLYFTLRSAMYRPQFELSNEAIVLQAQEDSHFLETLRGVVAVKAFGKEHIREWTWQSKASDSINGSLRSSTLSTIQSYLNELIFGFESVLIIAFGAGLAISGEISVGMLVAFISYKSQFTSRTSALIDKVIEFRLARVHLDRLADIALENRGKTRALSASGSSDGLRTGVIEEGTCLTMRGVGFRYSKLDPWVLRDFSLDVQNGEFVAISAPSGFGKTTLLKLMMGLLVAEEGDVEIAGTDISRTLPAAGHYAVVMQEDVLLSGSLADNISFFDAPLDLDRVAECAQLASIHDEISRMPMGYQTLVGDMGSALSGGQKQRVLLARALYVRPRILFLDEATSHLDAVSERRVHESISSMSITRIAVAHRAETLELADRVIDLTALAG